MPEPQIATAPIAPNGVLAFTPGQVVPDSWLDDHPEYRSAVSRRGSKSASEAQASASPADAGK